MKIDLTGQVALVTGGGRGIGRACSLTLARLGATVIINYRRSRDAAERLEKDIVGEGGGGDGPEREIAGVSHERDATVPSHDCRVGLVP